MGGAITNISSYFQDSLDGSSSSAPLSLSNTQNNKNGLINVQLFRRSGRLIVFYKTTRRRPASLQRKGGCLLGGLLLLPARSHKMSSDVEVVGAKNSLPFLHTWKLERLFSFVSSSGKMWDYSGVFPAEGYSWKLALKLDKMEAEEGKSYLSLFLALMDASPSPLYIEVVVESSILDENYSHCGKRKVIHRFRRSKSDECHLYLVSLETLECPSSGFLVAEIIDVVIHSEENVMLSPKPENIQNSSLTYTWKIDSFSKLTKSSYTSGPFLYNGHIWYLNIYPKGYSEEQNKSISLYLYLDSASAPPPFVMVRAEFYIDLVDQIEGKNHQLRCHHIFDWASPFQGWTKFLPLDALHEPSRGFLVNDTCIVKVCFLKCDISE